MLLSITLNNDLKKQYNASIESVSMKSYFSEAYLFSWSSETSSVIN